MSALGKKTKRIFERHGRQIVRIDPKANIASRTSNQQSRSSFLRHGLNFERAIPGGSTPFVLVRFSGFAILNTQRAMLSQIDPCPACVCFGTCSRRIFSPVMFCHSIRTVLEVVRSRLQLGCPVKWRYCPPSALHLLRRVASE